MTVPNCPNTPDVEFEYDRLGRTAAVTDYVGTRTLAYDSNTLQLVAESFDANSVLGDRVITRRYEGAGEAYRGRFKGLQVGTAADPNAYYAVRYTYDSSTGRLDRVTGPGLPGGTGDQYGAWYTYHADSDLVAEVQVKNWLGSVRLKSVRAYEADRDLLTYVQNIWRPGDPNEATISMYDYRDPNNPACGADHLGRRTRVAYSGVAFGSPGTPIAQPFGYNDRNELTASSRSDPNMVWVYQYDPIGNRLWSRAADDPNDPNQTYTANELNQYTQTRVPTAVQSFEWDGDGNLEHLWKAGDMNCDGYVSFADINAFVAALQGEAYYYTYYPNCNWLNADCNGDGTVNYADINAFNELLGGSNGALSQAFTWDAENRLTAVIPTTPVAGDHKVTFAYDYLGRRVEKKVYNWVAGQWQTTPAVHRKFVWSGWLMLMELDGLNADAVVRKYTWGLDLAGQNGTVASGAPAGRLGADAGHGGPALQAAGGIGGLLAVSDVNDPNDPNDPFGDFVYFYDANGNVGQVVDLNAPNAAAAIKAKYEYDPYGNRINHDPNAPEYDQPWRFSTHQFDAEAGLIYAKRRYYSPGLGRWITRDPRGERGGANLYAYVANRPSGLIDPLGLEECGPPIGCEAPAGACALWPPIPPAGFPALPSHETYDYPIITSNPGWYWLNNCPAKDVAYNPDEGWGLTVRNWPQTKALVADAKLDLRRNLKNDCLNCCKDAGSVRSVRYSTANEKDIDKFVSTAPGWDYFLVGNFRLRYIANCNVAVTCSGCKASCAITYDVWDGWHWGFPGTSCPGLNQFNWHVTWYCVDFIPSPCSDKPASSAPTTRGEGT